MHATKFASAVGTPCLRTSLPPKLMHATRIRELRVLGNAMPPSAHVAPDGTKPLFEPVFHSLIALLLLERVIPEGVLLDSGAFDGRTACFLAMTAPTRSVHAIEFLAQNADLARSCVAPNLSVFHGGLGQKARNVTIPRNEAMHRPGWQMTASWLARHGAGSAESRAPHDGSVTRMWRVDDFFASTTLGFAHWDIEGGELDVLLGARKTLRRDQPLFTVEVHVLDDVGYTQRLLDEIDHNGYDAFAIEEICGSRPDCRNLLCFPRSRRFVGTSHALDLAVAGGRLQRVTNAASLIERVRRPGSREQLVVPRVLNNFGEASPAFSLHE